MVIGYATVLYLTMKKRPFDLMLKGIKTKEYRRQTAWIAVRLKGKDYTHVQFTNGYGKDKPYFICTYLGFHRAKTNLRVEYENGDFVVQVRRGDYVISLGEILERGNIAKGICIRQMGIPAPLFLEQHNAHLKHIIIVDDIDGTV